MGAQHTTDLTNQKSTNEEVVTSFDFQEQFHVIQLDIGKMFREYPGAEQLKIVIGAYGSSIKIASMELLDKEGEKATKKEEPDNKPDIV